MSRHTVVTLACAAFIFLFFWKGCFKQAILRIKNESMLGREAPALMGDAWVLPDGVPAPAMLTPKRRWMLLAFFESDSGACIENVTDLHRLQQAYGPKGLVVIGLTAEAKEAARTFATEHDVRYPLLADAATDQQAFGIKMIWGTVAFLVDPEGNVVAERLDRIVRYLEKEFAS